MRGETAVSVLLKLCIQTFCMNYQKHRIIHTHIGLFPQLNSVVQVTSELKYIIDYLLLIFKSNSLPYIIAVSEL